MSWLVSTLLILTVLFTASIASLIHFNKMDKASKYISLMIIISFLGELIATIVVIYFKKNNIIYNISNMLYFFTACLYFNTIIKSFKKNNIGLLIGIAGIVVSLLNILFIQGLHLANTNFWALESIIIVSFCLYYFYNLLLSDETDDKNIKLPIYFWYNAILLTFWSFTFFYWLMGITIRTVYHDTTNWLKYLLFGINLITYTGFAVVFIRYKKY